MRKRKSGISNKTMAAKRSRLRRQAETQEQREVRLESQRLRSAWNRSLETEEEREIRLLKLRIRLRTIRYQNRKKHVDERRNLVKKETEEPVGSSRKCKPEIIYVKINRKKHRKKKKIAKKKDLVCHKNINETS